MSLRLDTYLVGRCSFRGIRSAGKVVAYKCPFYHSREEFNIFGGGKSGQNYGISKLIVIETPQAQLRSGQDKSVGEVAFWVTYPFLQWKRCWSRSRVGWVFT